MPRDGIEQGVGGLLLLNGTVEVGQRKIVKDVGGKVQKYRIGTGEDDKDGGRNLGWGLSNTFTCNQCFKV